MSVNMYLSVNNAYQNGVTSNTTELLVVPIIPAKIKVNKPQNLQEFETVSLKKLSFIAPADLKSGRAFSLVGIIRMCAAKD